MRYHSFTHFITQREPHMSQVSTHAHVHVHVRYNDGNKIASNKDNKRICLYILSLWTLQFKDER
jgi:diadenosine tetraphosphate (Ap4A) HIT family hydrolase